MAMPQTQIAAVLPDAGPSPVAQVHISTDHPIPVPEDEDILVKLEYSGVCHSDVHSVRGETPMSTDVAGHEGIGKVVQGMYMKREVALDWLVDFLWRCLVGPSLDEAEWMGKRVGIR